MELHLLGIRHHGVGSALNLVERLHQIQPDFIIIEGAVELNDALRGVELKALRPPVAILGYNPSLLSQSVFYPFASFSPEWQAMLYAQDNSVPFVMADMPLKFQFAYEHEISEVSPKVEPLDEIALIDGYEDQNAWWEDKFEHSSVTNPKEHFEAVLLLMQTLRNEYDKNDSRNEIREAFMREAIRKAVKEKKEKVVFVSGAWHSPALLEYKTKSKSDKELMKNLAHKEVKTAWIPWINSRLAWSSGYGAGIDSAGWSQHYFNNPTDDGSLWLYKASKLFRQRNMDISTAHTIEALRLAKALAILKGLGRVGLDELNSSIISVMCGGDEMVFGLISKALIVGDSIGDVAQYSGELPFQKDFEAHIKRYRLQKREDDKEAILDLRKEVQLEKSIFFHRLKILNIPWATQINSRSKGSFKEIWVLKWMPEFELDIIDKSIWGNSVEIASQKYLNHLATNSNDGVYLSALMESSLMAKLFDSTKHIIKRIDEITSVDSDIIQLMTTLIPLISISRYDDIRKTDKNVLTRLIESLIIKVTVNLSNAVYGLEYKNAKNLFGLIGELHNELGLIESDELYNNWLDALESIAKDSNMPPLIQGSSAYMLFNAKRFDIDRIKKLLQKALSMGANYLDCAYWIEGFLGDSAMILLIDDTLWNIVYGWVDSLNDEEFDHILPIVRRTFSKYSPKIRQDLGAKVLKGFHSTSTNEDKNSDDFDIVQARKSLEIVKGWLYYE